MAARAAHEKIDVAREPSQLVVGVPVDDIAGDLDWRSGAIDRVPQPIRDVDSRVLLALDIAQSQGHGGCNHSRLDHAEHTYCRSCAGGEPDGCVEEIVILLGHIGEPDTTPCRQIEDDVLRQRQTRIAELVVADQVDGESDALREQVIEAGQAMMELF